MKEAPSVGRSLRDAAHRGPCLGAAWTAAHGVRWPGRGPCCPPPGHRSPPLSAWCWVTRHLWREPRVSPAPGIILGTSPGAHTGHGGLSAPSLAHMTFEVPNEPLRCSFGPAAGTPRPPAACLAVSAGALSSRGRVAPCGSRALGDPRLSRDTQAPRGGTLLRASVLTRRRAPWTATAASASVSCGLLSVTVPCVGFARASGGGFHVVHRRRRLSRAGFAPRKAP